jgi:hypothetical protein
MENPMNIPCNHGQLATSPSLRKNHLPATTFLWLTILLMAATLLASTATRAEGNPYASNYQAQNQGNLHSMQANPEPQLFSGTRRDEDNIKMLENGYDLMGFSSFEAEDVPAEQATIHGRSIQADRILVYVKKAGNTTPASKIEMIKEASRKGIGLTEKDMAVDPTKYRYYATYWAKLPPPVLGVHVIKLVPRSSSEKEGPTVSSDGVRVIAVIHGSAAEKAGLLRGDQLLSINQEKVQDAAELSNLVRKYRGKLIQLQLERQDEPMQVEAQL